MGIKKLLTRDTNIIELTEKAPNMFLSRKVDMKKDLLEIWNAWYKYNDEYYYFKKMDDNPNRFVNELIGEKLANRLNLDTVHYEIAKQGYYYGVASKYFKNKDSKYYFMKDLCLPNKPSNFSNLERLKDKCKNKKEYNTLIKEILKSVAIDLYMGQLDRYQANIQFRKDKTGLHLAPMYDYEKSFLIDDNYLQTNLIRVDLNSDEYIRMYPYLKDLLEELFSTSIEDTIEEIEDERKIKVPNLIKFNYTGLVNNRQKTIKRTW